MAETPRFSVYGSDIIDTSTGKVLTPNEFNQRSTPEERGAIIRDLTARSLMANQESEGQIDEGSVDEDLAQSAQSAQPTTPEESSASPEPTLTIKNGKPPSLDEFLDVARPLNPDFDDRELAIEYRKVFPDAAKHYPAPPMDEWIGKVKGANPDFEDGDIKQAYLDIYGEPPKDLGLGGTLIEGAKSTGRSLSATGQALFGSEQDVVQTAKDQLGSPKDPALSKLLESIAARKAELGPDASWIDAGKAVGQSMWENPKGTGLLMAEQLPNTAAALGSAAVGAGIGALTPVPGGAVIGGLLGLFGANVALETGQKVIEKAADQTFTPEERSDALREGAIKGSVVSGVDAVTFGATKWLTGTVYRAMESATARVLADEGVVLTDRAAVEAASKNPAIQQKVAEAQGRARESVTTLGQRAARGGAEVGLETVGEGVGEYLGELAATGEADKTEAIIEAIAGFGQSAAEIGIASGMSRRQNQSGIPRTEASVSTDTIAPIMTAKTIDEAIVQQASTVDSSPISSAQLDQAIAPSVTYEADKYGDSHKAADQVAFERLIGATGPLDDTDGRKSFRGSPVQIVDPRTLPEQTAPDAGMSKEKYDALSAMAQAFGKRLVIFKEGASLPNGAFWIGKDPSRMYLADTTKVEDHFVVLAHEAMHTMQGTPFYDAFKQTIYEQRTPKARAFIGARHGELSDTMALEEMAADIGSTELQKPELWGRVFTHLREKVGDEQAKVEVNSFIDSLKQIIQRIKNLISTRAIRVHGKTLTELYVKDLEKVHDSLVQAVGETLYNRRFKTPEQAQQAGKLTLARRPLTEGRAIVPKDVQDTFSALASAQRDKPEQAMLRVQEAAGGGLLSHAVEHAGDLIHRMTEGARYGTSGASTVRDKVDRLLNSLTHAYGFEKEHAENLARNKADQAAVSAALKAYVAEHRALPVYNRAQWQARAAAIAVGEMRIKDAVAHLKALKEMVESKDFSTHAFEFSRGTDKALRSYLQPIPGKLIGRQIINSPTMPDFDLFNIDVDIPGHPSGSTVTQETMEKEGYRIVPTDVVDEEDLPTKSPQIDDRESPESRKTLSTTVPSSKRSTNNAYTQKWVIGTDDIRASRTHTNALVSTIKKYAMMSGKGSRESVIAEFREKVVENLLWFYDLVPADVRERAKRWYDGANRIASEWAEQDGYSTNQHAGVLAVLSPQKDWFMNVSLADRIRTIVKAQADFPWNERMTEWATSFRANAKTDEERAVADLFVDASSRLSGVTLSEMELVDAALFVRAYDQTYHERSYRAVTPEGGFTDYVVNKQEVSRDLFGERPGVRGTVAWGNQRTIQKAISILRDGSNKNISENLGKEHKVRNFYNNILDPNSTEGHVTIDTHAMAAAIMKALSGNSLEVMHLFGRAGSNAETGASGSYALVADAYREAAAQRGVLPREMQSVVWEAVRGLFPRSEKKVLAPKIEAIWADVRKGKMTLVEARREIFRLSGGVNTFAWEGGGHGLSPSNGGRSFDSKEVSRAATTTATEGLSQPGGVRGGERVLPEPYRPYQGVGKTGRTLSGLPRVVKVDGRDVEFRGFKPAQDAARAYMKKADLPYTPETVYHKLDPDRSRRIAEAFDQMGHQPNDPEVKAAYAAMITETLAQYEAIQETGLVVEFISGTDPYGNPRHAILDVVENNHLYVFSTREGFGSDATFDASENPLLAETPYLFSGKPTLVNDIFRLVHDYFGHIKDGVGFRAEGEDNAWRSHAAMFSDQARRAMTTETRGQNSWVNYGPHGVTNRTASPAETVYADQKIGLLPDWVMDRGDAKPTASPKVNDPDVLTKLAAALPSTTSPGLTKFLLPDGTRLTWPKSAVQMNHHHELARLAGTWMPDVLRAGAIRYVHKHGFTLSAPLSTRQAEIVVDDFYQPNGTMTVDVEDSLGSLISSKEFDVLNEEITPSFLQDWVAFTLEQGDRPTLNPGGAVDLVHYSRQEGLTTISPKYHGTGQTGAERLRRMNEGKDYLPRAFFYRAGTKIEPRFKGLTKYHARVPESSLVDLATLNGTPSERERAAKKAGYKGYYNSESSMPNVVAMFEPVKTGLDRPTFAPNVWFSGLGRLLEQKMPNKATAEQIRNIASAAKPEEVQWVGLDELLKTKDSFTKAEVLDFVHQNQVQMQEVEKGGTPKTRTAYQLWDVSGQPYAEGDETAARRWRAEGKEVHEVQVAYDRDRGPSDTKFSSYQLPGGENYRELLLTLPDDSLVSKRAKNASEIVDAAGRSYEEGKRLIRQYKMSYAEAMKLKDEAHYPPKFTSSHWKEPNVLAHVRMNDRTVDGKKVLFLEEVQSDWHQKGKKKGYFEGKLTPKGYREDVNVWVVYHAEDETFSDVPKSVAKTGPEAVAYAKAHPELQRIPGREHLTPDKPGAVPDAPFKKTWHELALKRMLRYAAEHSTPGNSAWNEVTKPESVREQFEHHLGSELASVAPLKVMDAAVLSGFENNKIRKAVIEAIPVDVMDVLAEHGFTSERLHGDLQMIGKSLPVPVRATVARGFADALELVGTRLRTALNRVLSSDASGGDRELYATIRAMDLDPRVVVGLLAPSRLYRGSDEITKTESSTARLGTESSGPFTSNAELAGEGPELSPTELADALNRHDAILAGRPSKSITNKYVAPSGYQYLAWTSGTIQAERYDLSKHLDRIEYEPINDPADTYEIAAFDKSGKEVLREEEVGIQRIEELVGKDIAQKIESGEGEKRKDSPYRDWRSLTGLDLKVGGEGMKGFYDQILPAYLNKYGKKWGAKVGTISVPSTGINRQYRAQEWVESGKPRFVVWDDNSETVVSYHHSMEEARAAKSQYESSRKVSVHALPITEAMRNSVMEGQPLFTPKPAPTFTVEQPGRLDKIIRTLQDKAIDIKRVVEAVQKAGLAIPDELNPVLKEEMYMKRAEQRASDFTNDELRPLLDRLRLGKISLETFDRYLHARHIVTDDVNAKLQAINPNLAGTPEYDKLAGMTDQEAQQIVSNASPLMAKLATQVDAIVEKTRDLMVTYGLETQARVDEWRQTFKSYVPLHREGFEDAGHPTGTGRSVRGSTVKTRVGSGLEVTNVLANVAQARDQIITRGEKQRPVVAMAGLLMLHPNPDIATLDKPAQITMTDPATGLPVTVPGNLTNYSVPTVRRFDPVSGTVKTYPDPMYKGRDNVVNFRVDGKDYAVVFNERNERAMEMAKAFKELDTPKLNGIMAAVAPYTRYLASINTQYNPIFGIVNFVRDAQYAMLALGSTPLAGKKLVVMQHAVRSLAGIYQDARAVRRGQHPTSSTARMWERFQHVGGPTGYRDLFFSSTDRADEIRRMMNPNTLGNISSPQKLGKRLEETWLLKMLSDYNTTMENSIRLGVFTAAVQQGISDIQAASYAKNITVNFNKKGQIGAQMGSLYAFFNANVQGTARILETLFEQTPTGARLTSVGKKLVSGGILVGVLQTFALAMAGFDDEEPPEYIKARNLVIPMPGTEKGYLQVPMPLGFNLLPNIGRAAAEAVRAGVEGKDIRPLERAVNLFGAIYGTFSPLGGTGGVIQEMMPTVADPFAAVASNKDWTGKSIAKEDISSLDRTPGHSRTRDIASVWATMLSKGINWATGGNEYRAGVYSPTPDTIDYLLEQVTGGIGRELSKGSQVTQSLATGEELPFHKVPLLGRFVGSASGSTSIRSTFYDNVRTVNEAYREFDGRAKDRTGDAHEFLRTHPEGRLREAAISIERTIGELNKVKKDLVKEGAPRSTITFREAQITGLMKRFNEMVEQSRAR